MIPLNRNHIQWIAISLPALLVGIFEFFRHRWLEHQLPGFWGNTLGALLVAFAVSGFIRYFIGVVSRTEQDLGRSRAEAAVLAERQRLAREMHDHVAQALFHLRVRLRELDRLVESGARDEAREEIEQLAEQITTAHDQIRAVISDLKAQAGIENPEEALRRGATQAAKESGLALKLEILEAPHLDAKGQQQLLAIVSEAMTNARRHGGASLITLSVNSKGITLSDNGRGFDPRRVHGDGYGLAIMEERARIIGGSLRVQSKPGRGTRITLHWEEPER